MGTRHLIAVMDDGKYKVAQYGQWDGYPEGQGVDVLEFLSETGNIKKLKEALGKVRYLDKRDDKFCKEYDRNAPTWSSDPDNRTPEQKRWFKSYISRDLGAKILCNIANSNDDEILLKNSIEFKDDALFCEWYYIVNFDKNTLEVGDIEFKLDNLPTEKEFLEACKQNEND